MIHFDPMPFQNGTTQKMTDVVLDFIAHSPLQESMMKYRTNDVDRVT
jgi:hypothetical protein